MWKRYNFRPLILSSSSRASSYWPHHHCYPQTPIQTSLWGCCCFSFFSPQRVYSWDKTSHPLVYPSYWYVYKQYGIPDHSHHIVTVRRHHLFAYISCISEMEFWTSNLFDQWKSFIWIWNSDELFITFHYIKTYLPLDIFCMNYDRKLKFASVLIPTVIFSARLSNSCRMFTNTHHIVNRFVPGHTAIQYLHQNIQPWYSLSVLNITPPFIYSASFISLILICQT